MEYTGGSVARSPVSLSLHRALCIDPSNLLRDRKCPPGILIYYGDLHWRSIGTLGYGDIYTFENDTGPDDANHAQDGLLIYYDPSQQLGGTELVGADLMQITPTLLRLFERPESSDLHADYLPL